jgi:hypothetical protein
MLFTPSQGLPYPASRREAANAPLASELLARKVDAKLNSLNGLWTAEMSGPTVVLTLGANITGIPANTDWPIFTDTLLKVVPPGWNLGVQTIAVREAGWYHCFVSTQLTCEGTINGSTKREMRVEISGSADIYNPNLVTERWICRDYERNGSTNMHVEFVTFLRPSYSTTVYINHANTSSTVRVDTANTQWSFTKICGEV